MLNLKSTKRRQSIQRLAGLLGLGLSGLLCFPVWAQVPVRAAEALFSAARRDDTGATINLLFRELDPNVTDEQGHTALFIAVREGSLKVANLLLDLPLVQVERRNWVDESPLMMAAIKGELLLAQRLIERQAEVNKPGWAPLHYAATNPEPTSSDMVLLLLEHHAYIDAESPNKTTPLMMASRYGTADVVQLLIKEGADPTSRNEQGLTALDFAQTADRRDVAKKLTAALRQWSTKGKW